jgi:hypothetical protein
MYHIIGRLPRHIPNRLWEVPGSNFCLLTCYPEILVVFLGPQMHVEGRNFMK